MNSFRHNNKIKGAGTALITPFTENSEVDYTTLRAVVEKNVREGIDFLCVLGTTAETPTLTPEEQMKVRSTVIDQVAGRVPLLLGYGGNNTAAMIAGMQKDSFEGFDAILIVAPFYNKPNQEGLFQHYRALAAASPKPIILYNVPGRTGVNILPETTLRIAAECPNVIGVKEASGKVDQICSIIEKKPEGFVVLSGDDALTCELMEKGADGVISVLSNARPGDVASLVHDKAGAREMDAKLRKYYGPLFCEGNPVGIKAMLYLEGAIKNVLRLPLVSASPALIETFKTL